jgi:hypothetical protein
MPDEQLGELSLEALEVVAPGVRGRYLGCRVLRTPIAYPIFLNDYEEERQKLEVSTGVRGLYTIGRNGEFAHILMEDVYWRTLRKTHHATCELSLLRRSPRSVPHEQRIPSSPPFESRLRRSYK